MTRPKQRIAELLTDALNQEVTPNDIEVPDAAHGDYAYPAMKAAAQAGENPRQLAEELRDTLQENDLFEEVSVAGPGFLNMTLDREAVASMVEELVEAEKHGVTQQDGSVLIEFSSPNVAKPMHVGHLRNNVLGDTLQRILRFVGYDVTSENYLGDWGTQYGKLIYAFKQFGSEDELEQNPMDHLYSLYVRFHDEMEDNKELEERGRYWASKIEQGDEEARQLWKRFRDASIEHHRKDYERLGIAFDRWTGESTIVDETAQLLEDGKDNGVIQEDDDGSLYIDFDDLPTTVLKKADGSTLYLSRDIATLRKRKMEGFDQVLYVVGSEQELHFQQLFAAADRVGIDTDGCEHISYGLLNLPEGSMSSREGRIVTLSAVLDEAVSKADARIQKADPALAEKIGIGAIRYVNCAVSRQKEVQFDWDTVLSFEGHTGPYIQYSRTRATSILSKTDVAGVLEGVPGDEGYGLLKKIAGLPDAVEAAAAQREPLKVADYVFRLCESFNTFYHSCPVLDAEEDVLKRRLRLVELFVEVVDTCLALLGMESVDAM